MSIVHYPLEIPVLGMDCASCARSVKQAVEAVPGVDSAEVLLSSEKAIVTLDPNTPASLERIQKAIESAGYQVRMPVVEEEVSLVSQADKAFRLLGMLFGAVLLVVVAGEWLGLMERLTSRVPFWVGALLVVWFGYPLFRQVILSAWQGRIIAHALMMVGALAALVAGEWTTAAIVVFFMRMGHYAELATSEKARASLQALTRFAPQTARVERKGVEYTVPVEALRPGEVVVVRPGEMIPADGIILEGHAVIDQATITGESLPVEATVGTLVYASTLTSLGSLRIQVSKAGRDTLFGRIIRLVEEAEAQRGEIQQLADRFTGYYLPIVASIAGMTYLVRQDLMATVAVLVVACSCAFALATPVAMLASIGAAARRGLLIKGGKYLERLQRADVVLLDKTGTLTLGQPWIIEVIPLGGYQEEELLTLVAAAERYSEHPLAEAIRRLAHEKEIPQEAPAAFEALPGLGIRARVGIQTVTVGNARLAPAAAREAEALQVLTSDQSVLLVEVDGKAAGMLVAADRQRNDVAEALERLRAGGIRHVELLTGDHETAARRLAEPLGIPFQANLLPEDKIEVVRRYQQQGHVVVMIGDGVNDAPALAQADVGIAFNTAGHSVAFEVSDMALLRDDWLLVPELFQISHRTMRVVGLNIGFTAVYNLVGLTLAALGFLPPVVAAAAQSLPDLGIMANAARLIRQR